MGVGVLIGAIIGLLILLSSPISYFILKKNGKRKAGIIVATILALIVLVPMFFITFESQLYFKSDAKKDLQLANIKLDQGFEIISNEITGMPEYFQKTNLKISEVDKKRIIGEILNSSNFKNITKDSLTLSEFKGRIESFKTIWNYKQEGYIVREYYEKHLGFVPIELTITLRESSDTLTIDRIED